MGYLDVTIEYGSETISDFMPEGQGRVIQINSPEIKPEITDLRGRLIQVLENPLQAPPLKELVDQHYRGSGKKVLLIADDNTRPNLHTRILYPFLLEYLITVCGVKAEDIGLMIASGTHRPPTPQEIRERILGEEIYQEYKDQVLIHSDRDNLADLGTSSNDTPITINQEAINSCLLIPVTDSEYHYFAGVAGTVKQLFPGIAGRITTNTNHTRMFDKETGFKRVCRLGNTEGNPVISDMKEMARIVQQHTPVFCIDAIMDRGKITELNAGDILTLHDLASQLLYDRRVIHVDEPGDLVIVTVGRLGINLFQSGKGIHAAWNATKKPGGTILLLAPCPDGSGSAAYTETMQRVEGMELGQALEWVIDHKCSLETFQIGNQKPVDMIRILNSLGEGHIKILSEMDPDELCNTYRMAPIPDLGTPRESLRSFLREYLAENPSALIYILQDAGLYIVPHQE